MDWLAYISELTEGAAAQWSMLIAATRESASGVPTNKEA